MTKLTEEEEDTLLELLMKRKRKLAEFGLPKHSSIENVKSVPVERRFSIDEYLKNRYADNIEKHRKNYKIDWSVASTAKGLKTKKEWDSFYACGQKVTWIFTNKTTGKKIIDRSTEPFEKLRKAGGVEKQLPCQTSANLMGLGAWNTKMGRKYRTDPIRLSPSAFHILKHKKPILKEIADQDQDVYASIGVSAQKKKGYIGGEPRKATSAEWEALNSTNQISYRVFIYHYSDPLVEKTRKNKQLGMYDSFEEAKASCLDFENTIKQSIKQSTATNIYIDIGPDGNVRLCGKKATIDQARNALDSLEKGMNLSKQKSHAA